MVLNFKEIYSNAWDVFKKNWWEYIVTAVIMGVLTLVPFIGGALQLFMYFLIIYAILKSVKGETISFSNFFSFKEISNKKVITIFLVISILMLVLQRVNTPALAIILSIIVFILTVIFFPFFCVMLDKDLNIKETILHSKDLTKGARLDVVILLIINFVIGTLGILLLLVGVFVAIPIIAIANVLTYLELEKSANI